ncbi:MAG: protease inhibitor I42 family protein [Bacteroidales bacterium]|nr:protease inhibitor I42 family protein [Bacteroidales bacterium]MCF8399471.1 protease inhibitor I42 family protein [Bacteroidales bacterium]
MKKSFPFMMFFVGILLASCSEPFTMNDNGRTVEFSLHSQFQIKLVGNPSTGYTWSVSDYDNNVLRQIGEAKFEAQDKMIGSPGTYTFTFETIAAGETTLKLDYLRKFEAEQEAEKTFRLHIISGTMGRIESD